MGARSGPFIEYIDGRKFVRVMDCCRSDEERAEITMLRRERWAMLAHRNTILDIPLDDREGEIYRTNKELERINARLFHLTLNPIYEN